MNAWDLGTLEKDISLLWFRRSDLAPFFEKKEKILEHSVKRENSS